MADIVDAATRSRMMSGIRGANTKPERQVRSLLHRRGFRFRLNVRELPGKPDVVLPRYRAVIFIHGCFWHGHSCHLFRLPATRADFWETKIRRNQENDARSAERLTELGWRVGTVWECAVRGKSALLSEDLGEALEAWLASDDSFLELAGEACR